MLLYSKSDAEYRVTFCRRPDRIRQRIPFARAIGKAEIRGWKIAERLYADIDREKMRRKNDAVFRGVSEGHPEAVGRASRSEVARGRARPLHGRNPRD